MNVSKGSTIEEAVLALDVRTHAELKAQYTELTGDEPPKRIGLAL